MDLTVTSTFFVATYSAAWLANPISGQLNLPNRLGQESSSSWLDARASNMAWSQFIGSSQSHPSSTLNTYPDHIGDSAQDGEMSQVCAWLDAGGAIDAKDGWGYTLLRTLDSNRSAPARRRRAGAWRSASLVPPRRRRGGTGGGASRAASLSDLTTQVLKN